MDGPIWSQSAARHGQALWRDQGPNSAGAGLPQRARDDGIKIVRRDEGSMFLLSTHDLIAKPRQVVERLANGNVRVM